MIRYIQAQHLKYTQKIWGDKCNGSQQFNCYLEFRFVIVDSNNEDLFAFLYRDIPRTK